jgi:predicted amidohydrolase
VSTSTFALAIAQFAPTVDTAANIADIAELAGRAAARGAQLVLFPENSSYFVDPFDETLAAHAQTLDGEFVGALIAMAEKLGIVLVAGMVEAAEDGRIRNTAVAVDASGVLAVYRKQHLYDAFGQRESDWVEPGQLDAPQTFARGGLTFGLQTCYDLRFPESTRVLVDAGADVILVPAQWVRGPLKEHHWRTLVTARAIESTAYLAGADHPPPLGVGHSMIVDPQGSTIASVGTSTDVAVAHLDPEMIANVRRVNPALRLRRYRVVAGE